MPARHSFSNSHRRFLPIAALGAASSALAACQKPAEKEEGPTPTPSEPVTISYWHILGEVRTEQLQQVFDDFMETQSHIKVEPLLLPNPGYQDKTITGLAGDTPDLTMIYTNEFAPSAKRGALKQVDEYMKADGISSDIWYPGVWDMNVWDGKAFGIPFVGNFLGMVYWVKDDLEAAGLDPESIGETWDELLDIAEKLTTFDDDGNVEHLGCTSASGWNGSAYRNGVNTYWRLCTSAAWHTQERCSKRAFPPSSGCRARSKWFPLSSRRAILTSTSPGMTRHSWS